MMRVRRTVPLALGALVWSVAMTARVHAQAANYPSLQVPTASTRDYTAAVSSGSGTVAMFQWREGWTRGRHWQVDGGVIDRKDSGDLTLFAGGGVGHELTRATKDQPLDVLLTAGVGAAFGGGSTVVRVPVGASIGHTFPLEQGMSVTPYVHPRASLDVASNGGRNGGGRSEVSLNFDLGVSFTVNPQFAVRASAAFTGSEVAGGQDSFAIGFNWTPAGLSRR